jgi:hypothetical protein
MSYAVALAYLLTAIACFVLTACRRAEPPTPLLAVQIRSWKILSILLALLGVVRPYDIYSRFSELLRTSAITGGWYNQRMYHQLDLILANGFFGTVIAAFLLFETRKWNASTRIAILGLLYLLGLSLMNILSLHGLDALLSRSLGGIRLRWLADLAGLGLLLGAAASFSRLSRTGSNAL